MTLSYCLFSYPDNIYCPLCEKLMKARCQQCILDNKLKCPSCPEKYQFDICHHIYRYLFLATRFHLTMMPPCNGINELRDFIYRSSMSYKDNRDTFLRQIKCGLGHKMVSDIYVDRSVIRYCEESYLMTYYDLFVVPLDNILKNYNNKFNVYDLFPIKYEDIMYSKCDDLCKMPDTLDKLGHFIDPLNDIPDTIKKRMFMINKICEKYDINDDIKRMIIKDNIKKTFLIVYKQKYTLLIPFLSLKTFYCALSFNLTRAYDINLLTVYDDELYFWKSNSYHVYFTHSKPNNDKVYQVIEWKYTKITH